MIRVNLLKKQEGSLEKARIKKIFLIFSGTFFVIAFILTAVLYIAYLGFSKQLNDVLEKERDWVLKVESLSETESYNEAIKQKMAALKQISKSSDYFESVSLIKKLQDTSMGGISLTSLLLDSSSKVEILGEANSSTTLTNFFDQLINDKDTQIKSLLLNSLSLSKDGTYRFSLGVNILKKKT